MFHVQQDRGVRSLESIGLAPLLGTCALLRQLAASYIRRSVLWELRPPVVRVSTVQFGTRRSTAPSRLPSRLPPELRHQRPGVVAAVPHGHGVRLARLRPTLAAMSGHTAQVVPMRIRLAVAQHPYPSRFGDCPRSSPETSGTAVRTPDLPGVEWPSLSRTCPRPYTPPVDAASRSHSTLRSAIPPRY